MLRLALPLGALLGVRGAFLDPPSLPVLRNASELLLPSLSPPPLPSPSLPSPPSPSSSALPIPGLTRCVSCAIRPDPSSHDADGARQAPADSLRLRARPLLAFLLVDVCVRVHGTFRSWLHKALGQGELGGGDPLGFPIGHGVASLPSCEGFGDTGLLFLDGGRDVPSSSAGDKKPWLPWFPWNGEPRVFFFVYLSTLCWIWSGQSRFPFTRPS